MEAEIELKKEWTIRKHGAAMDYLHPNRSQRLESD